MLRLTILVAILGLLNGCDATPENPDSPGDATVPADGAADAADAASRCIAAESFTCAASCSDPQPALCVEGSWRCPPIGIYHFSTPTGHCCAPDGTTTAASCIDLDTPHYSCAPGDILVYGNGACPP